MNVHLFGNSPSPAVANFGLKHTVKAASTSKEVQEFVDRNFYVDDGLISGDTSKEVSDVLLDTKAELAKAKLMLHKVVSNSVEVMEAIPEEDRASCLKEVDIHAEELPSQRSLGVRWNLQNDTFTFDAKPIDTKKEFTRRGVLSTINSVYDPIGFVAPIILNGKLFLQKMIAGTETTPLGWDQSLPSDELKAWKKFQTNLENLHEYQVPRSFTPSDFGKVVRRELHGFGDASDHALGVVVYLKSFNEAGETNAAFVYGQSSVVPLKPISTIPRKELCSAVKLALAMQMVQSEIDLRIDDAIYYLDSKVALSYIKSESKRFLVYVANRVQLIRSITSADKWRYIETKHNPADLASRGCSFIGLQESTWLSGPAFLKEEVRVLPELAIDEVSDDDVEVRAKLTKAGLPNEVPLHTDQFKGFSNWGRLTRAVANIGRFKDTFKRRTAEGNNPVYVNNCPRKICAWEIKPKDLNDAEKCIISMAQREVFAKEIHFLTNPPNQRSKKKGLRASKLYNLNPFISQDGLLRIGGRVTRTADDFDVKYPIILPKKHYITSLIANHIHESKFHQGRSITNAAIRQAGYWILGAHDVVNQLISSCVTCKRLRGTFSTQIMADLPADRSNPSPPFTHVGMDVFGPWKVVTRKLRGGAVNDKRWAVVFTCMAIRGVHIETIEDMDTNAFINALRRFFSIRGPACSLRCDRGTNFVGAKKDLDAAEKAINSDNVKCFLQKNKCEWQWNPPHASHFGGVWERQIKTIRRVLDGLLLSIGAHQLTHDLLTTFLAEVSAIVNARPISTLPSTTDEPQPLSPIMLMTFKQRPISCSPGDFSNSDLYSRKFWKRAQYLADQFWIRWRNEYLQNLQQRTKWQQPTKDIQTGDVVLLKEKNVPRNQWPIASVTSTYDSQDGKVRKADLDVIIEGSRRHYHRPTSELIYLCR